MHYQTHASEMKALPDLNWGLKCHQNKVKLPHPAFAVGLVDASSKKNDVTSNSNVVACLKDGTVFVIPILSNSAENNNSKDESVILLFEPVFQKPTLKNHTKDIHRGIERYTQGFTVGCIHVTDWGHDMNAQNVNQTNMTGLGNHKGPYIFHAWPGGVIDCHTCDLTY